jgi:hypothetical protein
LDAIKREYQYSYPLVYVLFSPVLIDNIDSLLKKNIGSSYVLFYAGRNGVYHILKYLNKNYKSSRIHIPESMCAVVIEAADRAKYKIIYYRDKPKNLNKNDVVITEDSSLRLPKGVFSIQDNAQNLGKPSKSFDFTLYSFGQSKPLTAAGGGAVVVNNKNLLSFLKISQTLKEPGPEEDWNAYLRTLGWRLRGYKFLRTLARKFYVMAMGNRWEEETKLKTAGKSITNLDRGMTKLSRRLASYNRKLMVRW